MSIGERVIAAMERQTDRAGPSIGELMAKTLNDETSP